MQKAMLETLPPMYRAMRVALFSPLVSIDVRLGKPGRERFLGLFTELLIVDLFSPAL
jgi:hypothetical protein